MRIKLTARLVLAIVTLSLPAAAQTLPGSKPKMVGQPQEKAKIEPPPAVPGARARAGTVAPAERGAADLPPTEALFAAINRGDVVTARDAVSRGADIDGTNLLGLTPLELSVDLNRNDITFLLLSLRGAGGSRSASAQAPRGTPAAEPATRRTARREPRATVGVAAVEAPAPIRKTPALFAGNGGTAVPAAGFLGFDAKR